MKFVKTLALLAALSSGTSASPSFAGGDQPSFRPLSIKTCNLDGSCQSPNGPTLDGLAQPSGVKQHGNIDTNGPSLDGLAQPAGIKVCNSSGSCTSPNGPSLDGLVEAGRADTQPASIKTCNADASCQSPNGPSESGLADLKLGTVIIAIDMP